MSEPGSDRAELLRAREDLYRQLMLVSNPALARDRSPFLVAKLRAMIAEIDDLLAEDAPGQGG